MNECRLCLKTGGKTPVGVNFPGFFHIEGTDNEFFDIITDIFGVKITLSPLMVFTVCVDCKGRLSGFYSYFKRVKSNLENLHSLLKNKGVVKKEASGSQDEKILRLNYKTGYIKEEAVCGYEVEEEENFASIEVEQVDEDQLYDDGMVIEALEEAETLPEISNLIKVDVNEHIEPVETGPALEYLLNEPYTPETKDFYALLGTVDNRIEYLKRHSKVLSVYDRRRIFYGFKCYFCDIRFHDEMDLQSHLQFTHNFDKVVYRCCDTDLTPLNQMDHITYHIDREAYKCLVCDRCFTAHSKLRRHFRGVCGKENVRCPDCGEEMLATQMYMHQRKHLKNNEVKSKLRLERPKPFLQMNRSKNPYECDICHRHFPKFCKVKYHIEMQHLGLYKEKCELCDKTFINKYSLEGHMRLHENITPEECPICGRFVKRLQRHISLNHETNAVICPECGKTFPNNLHYIRHKHKAHNKQIFKCEYCEKVFKEKTIMIEHRQAHLGGFLYTCEHCPYKANYKRNMMQHMKKNHYDIWYESKRNRLLNQWGPTMGPKYARVEEVQQEFIIQ